MKLTCKTTLFATVAIAAMAVSNITNAYTGMSKVPKNPINDPTICQTLDEAKKACPNNLCDINTPGADACTQALGKACQEKVNHGKELCGYTYNKSTPKCLVSVKITCGNKQSSYPLILQETTVDSF